MIAPVEIDGLAPQIRALGMDWKRKVEFHVTALSAAKLEAATPGRESEAWETTRRVIEGWRIGPIIPLTELRRVRGHPEKPGLQTIVVMVQAGGLRRLYEELSGELGAALAPPPAHVTIYSTDPEQGIGIDDERQLAERAPPLSPDQQRELRTAMRFADVFGVPAS